MPRYKDKLMQHNYEAAFVLFETRHRNYFNREGQPHRGSAIASAFWRGYFGERNSNVAKNTLAWAHLMAGRECRKKWNVAFEYNGTERWKHSA